MAVSYREGFGLRLTEHFWLGEFQCKCGRSGDHFCNGAVHADGVYKLVLPLERLRQIVGPILIESGYRCGAYHEAIYQGINQQRLRAGRPTVEVPKSSAHLMGLGADIYPTQGPIEKNEDNRRILRECGFHGVGWRLGQLANKLHVDVMKRGGGSQLAEWDYAT
jgi:hypothetical protein